MANRGSFSGSRQHAESTTGSRHEDLARYSCDLCRARKVKCDRKKSSCQNCIKSSQRCSYSPAKKRASRRQRVGDSATRLANMKSGVGLVNGYSVESDSWTTSHIETLELSSPIEAGFEWELGDRPGPGLNDHDVQNPNESQQVTPAPPGLCSVFSSQGARWVDSLVGDNSFSDAMSTFTVTEKARYDPLELPDAPSHSFPANQTVVDCVNEYLCTFNRIGPLFQREEVMALLSQFLGDKDSLETSGWAVINIMLAYAKFSGIRARYAMQCDQHFKNALKALPILLISEPDVLRTGVLLCIVQYLVYSLELKSAAAILGATIQIMLLARYQDVPRGQGSPAESLQKHLLLSQAFILDADLSIRLRKPPALMAVSLNSVPGIRLSDGCGALVLNDGSSINFLRERVALASLQRRVYSLLYSPQKPSQLAPDQIYTNITTLDQELQAWKANLPEHVKPQKPLANCDIAWLPCLTVLHYTYFQLVIAIHSMAFVAVSGHNTTEQRRRGVPSVALCVGAARASASLLNYEHCSYPFTVFLLHQVSWSIDILFINILQNRASSSSHRDLSLIEKVMKLYERFDTDYASLTSYRICCVLHKVALRAVHNALFEVQLPKDAVVVRRRPNVSRTPENPINLPFPDVGPEYRLEAASSAVAANTQQDPGNTSLRYRMPDMGTEWMAPIGLQTEFWQYFPTWTDFSDEEFDLMALLG